ncbi:hypothetical protein NA78x_000718 [Anatilimnocola sp. NA78]|uniref:hypothetical protein n=1 Tax=Anatilimnocola sp. NA78 TaxID=3415683 RepID=UPI003CE53A6A
MRRFFAGGGFCIAMVGLLLLAGCGSTDSVSSSGGDEGGGAEVESTSSEIKSYAIADLPEVEKPLAPQDQGRIVFSVPVGWRTLPKGSKSLAAMIPEEGSAAKLPRITINVSDPPTDDKASTTPDNAAEFAKAMQSIALKEGKKIQKVDATTPLILGDNTWVRHVRIASFSDAPCAIQSLQTIRSERLYTVELTVTANSDNQYKNSLKKHRDFAYAVAAHMQFPKDSGSAPAPAETPAVEGEANPAPTEEKKAE